MTYLDELPRALREIDEASDRDIERLNRSLARRRGERAEASPTPLVPVEVGDLATAAVEPPQFVVASVIPRGHVSLLGGHGGTGKSSLALAIAASIAAGVTWAGLSVAQGRALFVTLEDPGALVRWRLRAICEAYELDAGAVARNLLIFDGTESDACALAHEAFVDGRTVLEPSASMRQLRDAAAGATLIVVDNASDAFDGNENDRRQVRTFVRALAKIGRDNGAAVLLLAHIDKQAARHGSNGNTFSGSTAWHNSARSRLALVEADGAIELRHEKANLCRRVDPLRLRFNDAGVLLPLGSGAPSEGAVMVAAGDAAAVLVALQAAHASGDSVNASRTGPSNGHVALSAFGLPENLLGGSGRTRFWRAVCALLADGRATVELVRTDQRNVRRRIVPASVRQSPVPPKEPTHSVRVGLGSASVCESTKNRRTNARKRCERCRGEGCAWCGGAT